MRSRSNWVTRYYSNHIQSGIQEQDLFRNRFHCLNICPVPVSRWDRDWFSQLWFHSARLQLFSFSSEWTEQGAFGHQISQYLVNPPPTTSHAPQKF